MIHNFISEHLHGLIAWTGGIAFATATGLAQVATSTDPSLITLAIQAGMAGVVFVIVLKHIPALQQANERERAAFLAALEKQADSHEKIVERIVAEHAENNRQWREIISTRGYCPIRDKEVK